MPGKLSKALVIMLFGFATDEKTQAEAWEGVKNGAVKMWDDFGPDPWYNVQVV